MKRFLEEKMKREKESVLSSVEERIGESVNIKKREGELFREMLTRT